MLNTLLLCLILEVPAVVATAQAHMVPLKLLVQRTSWPLPL
jgi:hypothetical protein